MDKRQSPSPPPLNLFRSCQRSRPTPSPTSGRIFIVRRSSESCVANAPPADPVMPVPDRPSSAEDIPTTRTVGRVFRGNEKQRRWMVPRDSRVHWEMNYGNRSRVRLHYVFTASLETTSSKRRWFPTTKGGYYNNRSEIVKIDRFASNVTPANANGTLSVD